MTREQFLTIKARGLLGCYLLISYLHFDPKYLSDPNATKDSVRLLFALAPKLYLDIEYFDITAAFPHQAFLYDGVAYLTEPC